MDGAYRVTGVGPTLRLGGRRLQLQGRTVRHYGELEAEIVALRGNPFDAVRAAFRGDADGARQAFRQVEASWQTVEFGDIYQWTRTDGGLLHALWQHVRHAGVTFEDLVELVDGDGRSWPELRDAIEAAVDQASGLGELANLQFVFRDQSGPRESFPWEQIYRRLGDDPFGKSVGEISDMTLAQLRVFITDPKHLGDRVEFQSEAELRRYEEQVKQKSQQPAENLADGKRWDA